jgi:hypothetical protein
MRSVRMALAAGLASIVAVGAVVLSSSPQVVLASNSIPLRTELATTASNSSACQSGEGLARGTDAIRISLGAFTGPSLNVEALSGGRVVTSGARGSGWDGQTVTVPVRAVSHATSHVRICFAIPTSGGEGVELLGLRTPGASAARAADGQALSGRVRIEDLGDGHTSWLTLLPRVARNMGFGRAWSGVWVVLLVAILMFAATALASRLILRELHD